MTELEWKDPPRNLAGIADALRSRPGEWALVRPDSSPGVAAQWKMGNKSFPAGEFEFTTRQVAPGARRANIYGRYVGGAS